MEFEGTGISVFELKRDIIIKSGLGDGTDFDLAIYAEDGGEEYTDDLVIIPRSTTVVARRLPALKPGAGRAARYVHGRMPTSAKNSSRRENTAKTTKPATTGLAQMSTALTEEEKLAAMFQVQSDQWTAQQEEMALQAPVHKPGSKKSANVPDHDPPNGYICYRCGQKGHWIQVCPTNDNPEFDNRPRVKRTTGIPRSFLKTVDKSALQQNDGEDGIKPPAGVMVNAEGEFVIAEPDKASWEQFQAKTKTSAAAQKAVSDENKELEDKGLLCEIDNRLFIDPMKTPCCEKTYCNDCITNALIESDFVCPGCQTEGVLIDDLKPDVEASGKIQDYLKEKELAKAKERSKSPVDAKSPSPPADKKETDGKASKQTTPSKGKTDKPKSTTPSSTRHKSPPSANVAKNPAAPQPNVNINDMKKPGESSAGKKRPATDTLENPKIPKGPKAMQKAPDASMQNMMNGSVPDMMANMSMMNPMMYGYPGMNGFNNFNGNMAGMDMSMMGGMVNPMMGMNGFGPGGFSNNINGFNNYGGNMNGGVMGMGMAMGNANSNNRFQHPNRPNFTQPNNEDDAYFRKPVNPGRHQNRQRRNRPSDYREL